MGIHPLSAVIPLIREYVGEMADDAQGIIVVTDAQGTVLWVDGDPHVRSEAAKQDQLDGGRVVEREWRRDERDRNRTRGSACRSGIRGRALQRGRLRLDLRRGAGSRLGQRRHTRDHRSHGPPVDRSPLHLHQRGGDPGAVEARLHSAMLERDARLRSRYEERIRRSGRRMLVSNTGRILSSHPEGSVSRGTAVPATRGRRASASLRRSRIRRASRSRGGVHSAPGRGQACAAAARPQITLAWGRPAARRVGRQGVRLSPRHAEVLGLLASRRAG